MAKLDVEPDYLEKLAKRQDDAATEGGPAASAADGTGLNCWLTHGVISGASNSAIAGAEAARSAAGKAVRQAAVDLAAKLRTAKETYAVVDEDLSKNTDNQVLSK